MQSDGSRSCPRDQRVARLGLEHVSPDRRGGLLAARPRRVLDERWGGGGGVVKELY